MRRGRFGLKFYLLSAMLAVMGAGVFLVVFLTQQLTAKFFLIEKEDQMGFFITTLKREHPLLNAPQMLDESRKKELADQIILQHFEPVFMSSLTVLNTAFKPLATTLTNERLLKEAIQFAKWHARSEGPKAALVKGKTAFVRVVAPCGTNTPALYLIVDYKVGEFSRFLFFSHWVAILYALLYAVVASLLGTLLIDRLILKPMHRLLDATDSVSRGEYPSLHELLETDNPRGEMALLIERFAQMIEALAAKEDELRSRIEELERLNRELQLAQNTLMRAEKMASLGQLAAGVSHEIGNPLAAIQGYVEILEDEGANQAVLDELLPEIKKEVGRINRIVKGLLSYARPQQQKRSRFDLKRLVEDTISLVSPQHLFKRIKFTVEGRLGLEVEADYHAMQQVLVNLFLNAAQAMEGEGEIRVLVRELGEADETLQAKYANKLDPGKEYALLSVEDSGPGIPAEILPKIFDPFFTTKPVGEGTGLGLAIVQKTVEENGGIVDVESAPGSGSIFFVILPLAQSEDRSESSLDRQTPES